MNMQDITFVENEMEYTKDLNSPKTLAFGIKNNFNWWIISYGTHPCCYIEIPECHKFFGRHYDEISLEVHGGLTFSEPRLHNVVSKNAKSWYIGWDYSHCNDYSVYIEFGDLINSITKWTTNMLIKEVEKAIDYL